jgi:hypothetical protein
MTAKIVRACFAGFLGTLVVTCLATFASPRLIGGPADIAMVLARPLGGSWLAGMATYVLIGTVVLPLLYLALLSRRWFTSPAVRGATWGVTLWIVSQAVVVPLTGGGLFSSALGGLPVVTDSLIGHLAYGLVLGIFAGKPNERVFTLRHMRIRKPRLRRAA